MSTDLAIIEHEEIVPAKLFPSDDPKEIIARATETAAPLAQVIRAQKLAVSIGGREHVRVEGWTLLGTLLGVFPYLAWSRRTNDVDGWEARCEARTMDGRVVGSAEAMCSRSEKTWANRDDYALRSMAQTRATSKAMRQPLGFVMALAGFDPTPAEEMPRGAAKQTSPGRRKIVDDVPGGLTEPGMAERIREGTPDPPEVVSGSVSPWAAVVETFGEDRVRAKKVELFGDTAWKAITPLGIEELVDALKAEETAIA